MPTWAFIATFVVAELGILLLLRAVRGPWLDDHPRCRGCGYDLHGCDVSQQTCPECGRSLKHNAKAVRVGKRRRRPKTMLLALGLLVFAALLGGAQGYIAYQGKSWIEYAPYSVLRMRMSNRAYTTRKPALDEVIHRYYDGRVTDQQVIDLIGDTLDQLDRAEREWEPYYDDHLVMLANDNHFLPAQHWDRMQVHLVDYVYNGPMVQAHQRYAKLDFHLRTGRMTNAGLLYASDKVLAYQADPTLPWDPRLATPLLEAQALGILPKEKWLQYLRQGVEHAYTLEVRPIVRVGDPVPYRLHRDDVRLHAPAQLPGDVSVSDPAYERGVKFARLAGMEQQVDQLFITRSLPNSGGWAGGSIRFDPAQWRTVVPGEHTLYVEIEIAYLDVWEDAENRNAMTRFTQSYSAPTRIVAADSGDLARPVTALPDERGSFSDYLEVETLRCLVSSEAWSYQGWLTIDRPLPVAIRAEIVAVTQDAEYTLGTMSLDAGETYDSYFFGEFFPAPMPPDQAVALEFRPSHEAALKAFSVEPYWGETIVLEDIPTDRLRR